MAHWQPSQTNQTRSEVIKSSAAKPSTAKPRSMKDLACAFIIKGCRGKLCQNKYGHPKPIPRERNKYWCQFGDGCRYYNHKNGNICQYKHDYAWSKGHAPIEYECQFHTQSNSGCRSNADECWMHHPQIDNANDIEPDAEKEGAGLATTFEEPQDNFKQKYEAEFRKRKETESQLSKLRDDHKELEQKYIELKREVRNNKDYKSWDAEDVADWIIELDSGKYGKYKEKLRRNLKNEEFDGSCLNNLSKDDLHRLGISNFKDKNNIFNKVQELVKVNESHTME